MILIVYKVCIENLAIEFSSEQLAMQYCMENAIDVSLIQPFNKTVSDQTLGIRSVSKRQIRQAMRMSGITPASVEQVINAIPDELQRDLTMIAWQDADTYSRYDEEVIAVGAGLGMTTSQLDGLFVLAGTL